MGSSRASDQPARTPIGDDRVLRVLMVTAAYPTASRPHSGAFIKSQVDSLTSVAVEPTVLHLQGRFGWKYLKGAWQVLRLAHSGEFDVVHGHYGLSGVIARAQWRLPVVVSFCGSDLLGTPDEHGRRPIIRQLEVLSNLVLARFVDGIVVKSRGMLRVLWPDPRVPTAVIPNGVDLDLFRPVPRAVARKNLGLDDGRRYVLFPADPSNRQKGFPIAERAIERLHAGGVNIELLPVFGRPQRDLVDFYNAADVVVLPSLSEGSPNVVKEAMACGAPLVVTDVGDVREILGETPGCLVAERTPDAFARAILDILELPDYRTTGRACLAHLSLDAVARQIRTVYEAALAHHAKSDARRLRTSTT
jgi:teichuronic acid biosynthesis glycosyltransferase TuaC